MTNHAAQLLKLSDTDLIIANPSEDIRGRTARDVNGDKIGKIEDLLIDSDDNQVRLLRVEHGGILGFGATPSFVPVEAISRITDDDVRLRQAGTKVVAGPSSFVLDGKEYGDDTLLVISAPAMDEEVGRQVEVTGVVRQFAYESYQDGYGLADPGLYGEFDREEVLAAGGSAASAGASTPAQSPSAAG